MTEVGASPVPSLFLPEIVDVLQTGRTDWRDLLVSVSIYDNLCLIGYRKMAVAGASADGCATFCHSGVAGVPREGVDCVREFNRQLCDAMRQRALGGCLPMTNKS